MTFREGLIRARSHIIFLLALLTAFPLIIALDRIGTPAPAATASRNDETDALVAGERIPLAGQAPLRGDQLEWGRIAWRYFQANTDPETGLVNSADRYPSTTMWDTGSFLLGLISAYRIGVIDKADFDSRLDRALDSLARLPLFDGALPNKAYHTHTLAMVDYNNQPTERGLGWSALDIARLMIPLQVIRRDDPDKAAAVDRILGRWDLSRLVRDGLLIGSASPGGAATTLHQEGRVGYEEYAAKALILAGLDAYQAWRTDDTVAFADVEGVQVPIDSRAADTYGAQVYATSEPYFLDGLEFGFDTRSRVFAEQIYRAQAARYDHSGILTAVSEGHLDQPPNFAYATVWGNGVPWAVLTDTGDRVDRLRTLSTKAAFAWDALLGTPYTARLAGEAVTMNNPKGGWIEGRYEADGKPNGAETANTNGIILETLRYRAFGPILGRHGGP